MKSSKGTVLITAGTKGIGRAIALRLAAEGYGLILTYAHDSEAAGETGAACMEAGAPFAHTLLSDASKIESIETLTRFITEQGDPLTGLIHNAGITCRTDFEQMSYEAWLNVFTVNVHYPVFLTRALLPLMQRGSAVLFTGSMMAIHPHGMSPAYGASKSAVHALVGNLVKHLEPYGIRVAGVAPGFVDTDWQKNKPEEIRRRIESKVALHRFAMPSEIAEAFLFLLQNPYINGDLLSISGGYSYC